MEDLILPSIGASFKNGRRNSQRAFTNFLIPVAHLFGLLWSTLVGWFQHMLALPRLLLKYSNTHNFRSVVPKIMKFVVPQSLF
jgi:hypothetical protein